VSKIGGVSKKEMFSKLFGYDFLRISIEIIQRKTGLGY
jgi:hypothetical protein